MKKLFSFLAVLMAFFVLVLSSQDAHAGQTGYIWVDTEKNEVHGQKWMDGANIVVTIGEDEFEIAASQNGAFVLVFGSAYDIKPGVEVKATHAGNTVEYTPEADFSINFTQEEYYGEYQGEKDNLIAGTAPPESKVVLWMSQLGPGKRGFTRYWHEIAEVEVDAQGNWEYSFESQDSESRPFEWKDIHAFLFHDTDLAELIGEEFTLEEKDGDKYIVDSEDELYQILWDANASFLTRYSDPGAFTMGASYQTNSISGAGFPYGELEIEIERGDETFVYEYGILTEGSFNLHYDDHKFNVKPEDVITVSVGGVSITHEVVDLIITNIDVENDKIYGTTNYVLSNPKEYEQDYVFVSVAESYGQQGPVRVVEPNKDGTWVADFSVAQTCPYSQIVREPADVAADAHVWVYQDVGVLSPHHPVTYGRTTVANSLALIDLVRSFIVTRLAEFGALQTNISAVLDDPSQKLIFESPDFGRVEFSSFDIDTLLVINPEFLENMENYVDISYNSEDDTLRSRVDTNALEFLSGHEATIYFFDVAERLGIEGITEDNIRDYIDIKVYEDDEFVTDISDYFDWDNVTYDADEDILTLPVNHFTEYVLGESAEEEDEELPETGAAIVGAVSLGVLSLGGYAIYRRKRK